MDSNQSYDKGTSTEANLNSYNIDKYEISEEYWKDYEKRWEQFLQKRYKTETELQKYLLEQRSKILGEINDKLAKAEERRQQKERDKHTRKGVADADYETQQQTVENLNRQFSAKNLGEYFSATAKTISSSIAEKAGEVLSSKLDRALSSLTSGLTSKIETSMDQYISEMTSMTAHLVGTSTSLSDLTTDLRLRVGNTGLVKQENIYKQLATLVKEGSIQNVEQRAFLQAIADDINAVFDADNGYLTRLIRIQTEDMSANRLAIEYSLQEFLNQNYQTSEYIKSAMGTVSESLLEMQSIMGVSAGMAAEATLQTWLGSMYSAGVSQDVVTGLAKAINDLGSGNVDNLGTGISNLLLMGVNRAGLDYSQMINEGVNSSQVDAIMRGVISYMGEIGESSSNVVKSQWAKAFGMNISDIAASQNIAEATEGTLSVSTDIYSVLLSGYKDLVPVVKRMDTYLANLTYGTGTALADNSAEYMLYRTTKFISEAVAEMVGDKSAYSFKAGPLGELSIGLAEVIRMAPLLTLLPTLVSGGGAALSSIVKGVGLSAIFDALGRGSLSGVTVKGAGSGTSVTTSGSDVSQSMYVGNDTGDILSNAMSSGTLGNVTKTVSGNQTSYTVTDVYNTMEQGGIPNLGSNFERVIAAVSDQNSVGITNTQLMTLNSTTAQILSVLQEKLYNIESTLSDMGDSNRNPSLEF